MFYDFAILNEQTDFEHAWEFEQVHRYKWGSAGAKKGMFPRSQDRVLQCPNQGPRVGAPEEVLGGEDDKRQLDLWLFCNLRQVPRKHCQSVPVKKPRWTWEVLVGIKLKFPLRIVTKTVPRKNCEYGSGGHSDGGKGYDSAHGHGGGWDDKTSLTFSDVEQTSISSYGHDHGGGYGKGGGGGYDDHRKVDNEGKVHWVDQKRGDEEKEYRGGLQEAGDYSSLVTEDYKAGSRESGNEQESYSASQGPGYSYSHHRRKEEAKDGGHHHQPPRYHQHHGGGEDLTPAQHDLDAGESFPAYDPHSPSRRYH